MRKIKEAVLSAVTEFDTDNPTDEQILRLSITSELSAVNLYQYLSKLAKSKDIRETLLSIAEEEKVHVAEFTTRLNEIDAEQVVADIKGKKETESIEKEKLKEDIAVRMNQAEAMLIADILEQQVSDGGLTPMEKRAFNNFINAVYINIK